MENVTVGEELSLFSLTVLFVCFRSPYHMWECNLYVSLWLVGLSGLFPGQHTDVCHHHWCTIRWVGWSAVEYVFVFYCSNMVSFILLSLFLGKLCLKLSCYFLWPFGKAIHEVTLEL